MSYHLNIAQTIKGRPRLEICLLWKAKLAVSDNTNVGGGESEDRARRGYSAKICKLVTKALGSRGSRLLSSPSLKTPVESLGTLFSYCLGMFDGNSVLGVCWGKWNYWNLLPFQCQVKVTFCFLVPGIWFLFSCLFSYIFKCPQVFSLSKIPISPSGAMIHRESWPKYTAVSGKMGSGEWVGNIIVTVPMASL